jgi:hypothetical protein
MAALTKHAFAALLSPRLALLLWVVLSLLIANTAAQAQDYDIVYRANVHPDSDVARVEIQLRGERLPSRLTFSLNPERHQSLRAEHGLTLEGDRAVWKPREPQDSLYYEFVIDEQKASGRYDSLLTDDWAILRSDKLVPPISARGPKGLQGHAKLQFMLPDGWSAAAPYPAAEGYSTTFLVADPGRSFPRPKGWLILGDITSRQDIIDGVDVRVAAPAGQGDRLQDTLAFIAWTLPEVKAVLPDFPSHLLIVTAGKPMWRGGLSGTRSLFMHADRPMISGNRTSSLIHELIHVGTGINGGGTADWIVEGLAEYYSSAILHRSGGMSDSRYAQVLAWKAKWAKEADTLFVRRSSGPVTARAAVFMHQLDKALVAATDRQAGIDDVAQALAENRGRVSLAQLKAVVFSLAGDAIDVDALIEALEGSG